MIVISVKLGVKPSENGEFEQAIVTIARDTETGEVASGGFSGSRETILKIIRSMESNPEVRIKYE